MFWVRSLAVILKEDAGNSPHYHSGNQIMCFCVWTSGHLLFLAQRVLESFIVRPRQRTSLGNSLPFLLLQVSMSKHLEIGRSHNFSACGEIIEGTPAKKQFIG